MINRNNHIDGEDTKNTFYVLRTLEYNKRNQLMNKNGGRHIKIEAKSDDELSE